MTKKLVAGVRFKPAGKIYDFETNIDTLEINTMVIVETEQGLGMARIINKPKEIDSDLVDHNIKSILRISTKEDEKTMIANMETEKLAFDFCKEQAGRLGLKMHLFKVESTFDRKKLTFFFTADGRIDFRELVKILVKEYHIRIEMRQVGIRQRAKLCGGVGRCGLTVCCSTHLGNFDPISIKMAKVQGLSLNPTKISGVCGRLMCCLNYENDTYKYLKKDMPHTGDVVITPEGSATVSRQIPLKRKVVVVDREGVESEWDVRDIKKTITEE